MEKHGTRLAVIPREEIDPTFNAFTESKHKEWYQRTGPCGVLLQNLRCGDYAARAGACVNLVPLSIACRDAVNSGREEGIKPLQPELLQRLFKAA